jgi:hypothetical protein
MKHEYRKTKPPTIEENYDRPQKKRGGKKKPFSVVGCGWKGLNGIFPRLEITLGRYETHERAAQAMKKLELIWGNCKIEINT